MGIYWRCSICPTIEHTSGFCKEVMHTHALQYGQIVKYSLLPCRSLAEAKSYRTVKYRRRFGLRKQPTNKRVGKILVGKK